MKRLIHVYTGDGKGKTTAAVGLTIRMLGHKFKVCYITFQKDPKKYGYGEFNILKKLHNLKIYNFAKICPYFDKKYDKKLIKQEIVTSINFIKNEIFNKNFDLIVLDEILVCVREKLLSISQLVKLLKSKPENTELVLTGQSDKKIVQKLKKYVDYISYIKKIKHPYDKKILIRKGIEY